MNKDLLTEIKVIDHQHQEFHTMIESLLLDMMDWMEMEEFETIRRYILYLETYAIKHFKLEEALMEASNYPKMAEHIQQHKYYIAQYREYSQLFASGEFMVSDLQNFHRFLMEWYKEDIRDNDLDMAKYIKEKSQEDPTILEKLKALYQEHFKE